MARTFQRGLAVALADVEVRRRPDLAHQGVDVGARVHAVDGAVVDPLHGLPHGRHLGGDAVGALDGVEVAGEQALRREVEDEVERVDVGRARPGSGRRAW